MWIVCIRMKYQGLFSTENNTKKSSAALVDIHLYLDGLN